MKNINFSSKIICFLPLPGPHILPPSFAPISSHYILSFLFFAPAVISMNHNHLIIIYPCTRRWPTIHDYTNLLSSGTNPCTLDGTSREKGHVTSVRGTRVSVSRDTCDGRRDANRNFMGKTAAGGLKKTVANAVEDCCCGRVVCRNGVEKQRCESMVGEWD